MEADRHLTVAEVVESILSGTVSPRLTRDRAVDLNSQVPFREGDRLTTPRREIRATRAGLPKSSYLRSPSSRGKPRTRANFGDFSGECATSKTRWRREGDLNPRDPSFRALLALGGPGAPYSRVPLISAVESLIFRLLVGARRQRMNISVARTVSIPW